jgi:hypothetical protein
MKLRCGHFLAFVTVSVAGSVPALAQTPVDTGWTYQGKLTDGGSPANGSYDLRFSIYLDNQGTLQTGPTIDQPSTPIVGGLFTTKLDFGAQFTGLKTWLLVEISPEGAGTYTALPLQEITSAPQALFAQTLGLPYSATADVPGLGSVFALTNTDANDGTALWARTDGMAGTAVYGLASATSGFNFGGLFETNSTDGRAVRAVNNATTGLAVAGRFGTAGDAGIGVWSTASSISGVTYGVYGDSFSNTGVGVYGRASCNFGNNFGVFGETVSGTGMAVQGRATASTGANFGLHGESFSTGGTGVYGIAGANSGFTFGGDFLSSSPDGRGVRGNATATTGLAVGGRFASASTGGIGVWSTASATSGVNYGVYGDTNSSSGYGGYFKNSGIGGTALWVDGIAQCKTLRILGGSDLAEPFNIHSETPAGSVQPGMVVAIDPSNPGDLRLADQPYDTKVAGVISGANGLNPGMVMKAEGQEKADGEHPVAMTGRVWCYVDASFGPVKPGDRLTTSATPGHAMKADETARCGGAVIGKAMTELKDGKGLVLVLVNLQ